MKWILATASLLLASAAALADGGDKLAVLELRSKLKGDERERIDAAFLSNVVRRAALAALPELHVMSKDSMFVMLRGAGKDPAECAGECDVDSGRIVGAEYVVGGEVLRFGEQFKVDLMLHETRAGRLLSAAQASGATAEQLQDSLERAVLDLLSPLLAVVGPSTKEEPRAVRQDPPGSPPAPAATPGPVIGEREPRALEADRPPVDAPARKPSPAARADEPGAFRVRVGLGALTGVLGAGFEYHPGFIGVAIGTGTYAVSGGLSFAAREGGPYLDVHAAWSKKGLLLFGDRELDSGVGVGATVGWDLRPVRWLSLKAGAGGVYNSATWNKPGARPLVLDLCGGVVF